MQTLEKTLRNQLERVVKEARDVAETAARIALDQLGVGASSAYSHLTDLQRDLRRRLRIHGRQLGDRLDINTQNQELTRLVEEVAYEHWHRMLFAKFLAENNLLMYPDPNGPIAVTLEECEDLAVEEGARNGWELASRFAARMLPQIFQISSPILQLILPPEYQQQLERLLISLSSEVFLASDSLGWVYQFWQSKKKEIINNSGVKIGAQELPAVTQLFTEPYMVHFLLDNSIGAWWATKRLSDQDLLYAEDENELRTKASYPSVPLKYLRFDKTEEGRWTPAAGSFSHWPNNLKDFKLIDPCCGSGHFLVSAFHMLVPIRMEIDRLNSRQAVDAVLHDNIYGLELDQRCVELAAFALALNAWRYPNAGGFRPLPDLNIACSGLSIGAAKEEWKQLAMGKHNLRIAMDWMFETYKDAPILGSLINPTKSEAVKLVPWNELSTLIESALKSNENVEQQEAAIVAHGLSKAALFLAGKYHLVITNPPYLGERKQNSILRNYIQQQYYDARADLALAFLYRNEDFVFGNTQCLVLPQNWLYQSSYKKMRKKLLQEGRICLICQLGSAAFESSIGADVLLLILNSTQTNFNGLDCTSDNNIDNKKNLIRNIELNKHHTLDILNQTDSRIVLEHTSTQHELLEKRAEGLAGIQNGDTPKFIRYFWEIPNPSKKWWPQQATFSESCFYGGLQYLIDYDMENGHLNESRIVRREKLHDSDQRGNKAWGKRAITVSLLGEMRSAIYTGWLFDQSTAVILPKNDNDLVPIFCFTQDASYNKEIRKIDKKRNVTNSTLVKIPYDYSHWQKIAKSKYPYGIPLPFSDDLTQWIFHGHPCGSVIWSEEAKRTTNSTLRTDKSVLQAAVARLLGYRWPAELNPNMELADEQREWVNHCDSLNKLMDTDGIVCIPSVRGEPTASERLLDILAACYKNSWNASILGKLLANSDQIGKTLESWLREKFFTQHIVLFQHVPFIWQIWDGLHDGFSALVNYHKLDKKLLETLIFTYLGDWINRQKQDVQNNVDGSQEKLAAAERLKKSLELILEGEAPYDIFVRWKPINRQPVGWDPDINDGVRINIRPFLSVPDVGKKGAGILRDKPNINWNKDRGQDIESAPWYKVFAGERINDHHLTLEEKKAAQSK